MTCASPPERRTFADLDTLVFAEPLDVDELAAMPCNGAGCELAHLHEGAAK